MGALSDIDRLIELGLNRYGAGDLDGALLFWEEALAIDPENQQASSYVDYVRLNYDLLSQSEPALAEDPAFPIEDEPEYQIEIQPGELPAATPGAPDALDDGWSDEETRDTVARAGTMQVPQHDSFEGATREYQPNRHGDARRPSDYASEPTTSDLTRDRGGFAGFRDEGTGGFVDQGSAAFVDQGSAAFQDQSTTAFRDDGAIRLPDDPGGFRDEGTFGGFRDEGTGGFRDEGTFGFSNQETEIRKRDLGFVQAVGAPARAPSVPEPVADKPSSPLSVGSAPTIDVGTRDAAQPPRAQQSTPPFAMPNIDLGAPTRELGLRPPTPGSRPVFHADDEDLPTKQSDVRAIRDAARGLDKIEVSQFDADAIEARNADILDDVDRGAPLDEQRDDQTKRRITALVDKAVQYSAANDLERAVAAADLALEEDPTSAVAAKLLTRHRDALLGVFQLYVGDLDRQPQLAKPLHELANAPINPRAAFLLSRIDGTLTVDELLDVSGMPRLEAYRYLCQLLLRGILR